MSLRPDDRASRSRSKSGTHDRSRSRSNVRAPKVPSPPSSAAYGYPPGPPPMSGPPMPGSFSNGITSPSYEVRSPHGAAERPTYFPPTSAAPSHYPPAPSVPYPADDGGWTMGDYTDLPPHERPGYVPPPAQFPQWRQQHDDDDDDLAYEDSNKANGGPPHHPAYSNTYPPQPQYPGQPAESPSTAGYRYTPQTAARDAHSSSHGYQYAPPPEKITYTATPQTGVPPAQYSQSAQRPVDQLPRKYSQERHNSYSKGAQVMDITPGHDKRDRTSSTSKPHRLSVNTDQPGLHAPSAGGPGSRMDRLSISGNRPDMHALGGAGGMPPASPLLEAYHGTYQSLSPMHLAMRPGDEDDMSDFEPLSSAVSKAGKKGPGKLERDAERSKEKKRVVLYDAEEDAKKIAKALNHHKVDPDPLIDILPSLSHDQIWELRKEYKKQVKIQGKGINLPKHLKLKVTGNFGKAAYVTALGRWEGEGYWANFWYQSHGSRRELLIETLMGRPNLDIRNIKDEFKDKRYSDSLTKCMEKELKMDKFRTAVLMALEERRQEEQDVYPPEYRNRDVEMLHRALTAKQGGESAMLEIIVRRSDAHLREVLRTYERTYDENFARAALKKSNNLVGEVIAHILNGVINKPARDALLLQHAIKDVAERNKDDDLRYELLISRLVRLHWDKLHLSRVKRAYAEKYGRELQEDVEDATKGDFREFMCELVEAK
ncbi:hypothetical protein LTR36_010305 [Oleoguttula mirabilis]|uniref:Annexin n=1 Tax=Oleoguttula mirabilis TaxID=1507867 RepID=A0AAV9J590_9PEZI|nr:hypothetical protein LTR36_010305 [Oleoguttula mirabilis]